MPLRTSLSIAIGVLIAGLLSFAATSSQGSGDKTPQPLPRPEHPTDKLLLGAGSCAAAACHNSSDVSKIAGREYALCLADEKHGQAYNVLLEDRSKKIQQRLDNTTAPERNPLCLKCHVHPDIDSARSHVVAGVRQFDVADGVSCEACHGPAQGWLDRHHRPDWKRLSPDEKRSYGMLDTRNVVSRAKSCVACHVGDAARGMEVNHDLLAAGHPRLAFEFAGYHSLMKKHWDDALDRDPSRGGRTDFEADAWMKGQAVALKASLELLQARVAHKSLPEFAEFDCYACHHDLRAPGASVPKRNAPLWTWNRWPTSQAENALAMLLGKNDPDVTKELKEIGDEMNKLQPNEKTIRVTIPKVIAGLDRALKVDKTAPPVRESMAAIAGRNVQSWDDAAQIFNGLIAWEKTRLDRREPEIPGLRPGLESLRQRLLPDGRFHLKDVRETTDGVAKSLR